jgi:hypothetical protein
MMTRLDVLAARKELLVAQSDLQRVQLRLHAAELGEALRPARLISSAAVRPSAALALAEAIAAMIGGWKLARWIRIASLGFVVFRIVRAFRHS